MSSADLRMCDSAFAVSVHFALCMKPRLGPYRCIGGIVSYSLSLFLISIVDNRRRYNINSSAVLRHTLRSRDGRNLADSSCFAIRRSWLRRTGFGHGRVGETEQSPSRSMYGRAHLNDARRRFVIIRFTCNIYTALYISFFFYNHYYYYYHYYRRYVFIRVCKL